MLLADDLTQLLNVLPKFIKEPLEKHPNRESLIEIVLDIGRRPEARFSNTTEYFSYRTVVWQDLDLILKKLGKFSSDNRAGIEKTLHRISSLRNRNGSVIGLTCRIGRAFFGTVSIIRDLLEQEKSILLLGRPGVGKTTAIREIARVLSDGMKKRVIIIDTSNEIAGDGDLPHPSIGKARRMQVSNNQNQHEVMIEAVENHMPEIIIIDEIGTESEAFAARTIAERGVQLVGTAHGNALENLIKNPTITDLIGGIQYVTLGDEEAKRRGSAKSILERKAPPTFDIAIELPNPQTWIIHENIEKSVDLFLQGQILPVQKRTFLLPGKRFIDCKIIYNQTGTESRPNNYTNRSNLDKKQRNNYPFTNLGQVEKQKAKKRNKYPSNLTPELKQEFTFLYTYGINIQELKPLIKVLQLPIILTKEIQYADTILTLENLIKSNRKLKQISHAKKLTVHTIQNTSLVMITRALRTLVKNQVTLTSQYQNQSIESKSSNILSQEFLSPLEEVRLAIEEIVVPKKITIDLFPQTSLIRKQQHEIIAHYQLDGTTVGTYNNKRIRIFPN
jgi:stage III sporulation protein SpoIIIAA